MRYRIIELKNKHPAQVSLVEQFAAQLNSVPLSCEKSVLEKAILGVRRKRPLLGLVEKFGSAILEDSSKFNESILELGLTRPQRHCFLLWVNELDSLMATQVCPLFFQMSASVKFCFSNPLFSFGGWRLDDRGHLIGVSRQIFHWVRRESDPTEILFHSTQDATRGWFLTKQDKWPAEFFAQLCPLLSFECAVDMSPDGALSIQSRYVLSESLTFFSEPFTPIEQLPDETSLYTVLPFDASEFCALLEQQFFKHAYIDFEGLYKFRIVLQSFRQERVTFTELTQQMARIATDRALSATDQLKINARLLCEKLERTKADLDAQVSQHIAAINPPIAPSPPGLLQQFSEAFQWFSEQVIHLLEEAHSMDWRP